ncbi:MAG: hypothetical protein KTR13_10395, partial [Saprospiraceae bacterium]|nr:hypothetical protein [Saprospiraceae bacterium]
MALTKNQKAGILCGILVFLVPLIVVSIAYLGGKPQVKVLPFLGEHKEVDESITEYYKLPAFV